MTIIRLVFSITILLTLFCSFEVRASSKKKSNFGFRPPNNGAPAHTVGGAVRGNICAADKEKDSYIKTYTSDSSLTAKSHPKIVVFVPELDSNKQGFLIIKDREENYYEKQPLTIPSDGGKIVLALDSDRPSLESGITYEYFLRIQCKDRPQPMDPVIKGSIERVAGNIILPAEVSLKQQFEMLVEAELWYDALYIAHKLSEQGDSSYWEALTNFESN